MADAASLPLPAALSLQGRRIAVTGAASGIGRATAGIVAQLGGALLLCDMAPLDAVADELKAGGAKVETLQGDLTADGFVESFFRTGPIDGLAQCAGIYSTTPLHKVADPKARFHRMMDVNVRVPAELGMACIEHMGARGGGAMVLFGSVAGRNGGAASTTPVDYAASKGAVHAVVRWLSRNAVGRNVLVNGIAPGPIDTPMTRELVVPPGALPLGRMGRPEEIGWMAAFLLTPAASYLSGAVIDINGGAFVG